MKLTIKDINGKDQGELEVQFPVIENGAGTQAVHDVVVAYQAAQRMGTACAKTVGEVAGSGSKPWRQKGTGRARAGRRQSPVWRGGAVVFGPRPRDFGKKVNKKVRQLALRKALSERLKAGDVIVVDDLKLEAPKTKHVVALLSALDVDSGTVILVADGSSNDLLLASRNLLNVDLTTSETLNTYDVLRPDKLVFAKSAFEQLQERLKKN
jgi:large subunit ribosomal protein L4